MGYIKYKKSKEIFKDIYMNPSKYLIIHYSCESFYDIKDGKTPRITSIAICHLETSQADSFSIHKTAEKKGISIDEIDAKYDELEKSMLDDYFQFVKEHRNYKWLHLNMRNITYGFKAIEHRYEVLGGMPELINDSNKIDLAILLVDRYGVKYMDHPRLENIVKMNKISNKEFLNGKQEAEAFNNKEYIKLHQSTLRKVDIMSNIIGRVYENTLKTNSKWYNIYGCNPQGMFEYIKENWLANTIYGFIMLVIGALIGKLFS